MPTTKAKIKLAAKYSTKGVMSASFKAWKRRQK
jgi:hypothetical protein